MARFPDTPIYAGFSHPMRLVGRPVRRRARAGGGSPGPRRDLLSRPARPAAPGASRRRHAVQLGRDGDDLPVLGRPCRLQVPLRADAPLHGRARGAPRAVRLLPGPVHRRPQGGGDQPGAGQHERLLPRRTAALLQGGQPPDRDRPGHPGDDRRDRLGRGRVEPHRDGPPEDRPGDRGARAPRLRRQGRGDPCHRVLRGRRHREGGGRGMARGTVPGEGPRLGGHRALRGVPPHPARHGPRACEGRRRRLRVGRISRWLSRGAPAQGRRRRDPLAPQHEPVRRPCDERVRRRAARARRHARRHDEPVPVLPRRHRLAVRPEGVAGLPVPMDRRHRGRRVVRGGPTGRRAGGALAHGRPLRHETVPVRPAVAHRRPRGRPLRAADRGLPVHRRGDPRDGLLPRLLPGRPDGAAGAVLRHAPCHGRRGRRVRARRRGAARGDAQQPLVLDASDPGGGPVATLALPFRLRYGLRGNWVAAATLAGRKGTVPTTGKGAS